MATYASRPRPRPELRGAWARVQALPRATVPLAIVVIVLVSAVVRSYEISIGFWIDEGLSVGIADRPLGDIPSALRKDGSPPVYYVLLHFWIGVFGHSEAGVRALSLLFALLAVPVAWWAGRALFGTRGAWTAALLAALNPFLTQYAQEARMYALVALLGIIATTCFVRAFAMDAPYPRARRPWLAGFVAADAVALYTHNWAIFFTVACGIAWLGLLVLERGGPRLKALLRDGVIGFGAIALLYAPWIPTTLYQAAHTGAPWAEAPSLSALLDVPHTLLGQMPQVVLLLSAGTGLVALAARRDGRLTEGGRVVGALVVVAVLTVVLAWTGSQLSPAWANRYLAIGLAPFLLLAAGGLANAGRLGLVGLALVVVMWAGDGAPVEKSNVRAVMTAISPSLAPGDLVVSTQPETVPVLHYYLDTPGLHYATLTGRVTDLGVWDWRNGVDRLQATSAQRDLAALVDALPPGHRLVLVQPITWALSRWQAPWTQLVRIRSEEWAQYLSNRPDLHVTAIQPPHFTPPRPNPVQATVMVKS